MSKLLQRLSDASRSGVYRTLRDTDLLDAVKDSALSVTRIDLAGVSGKSALLERIARALRFPDWFGGTWDALEDCLADLSWIAEKGYVLVFDGAGGLPADDRGVLVDVLSSAASYWRERGRPFFAVFLERTSALPELYRPRE